MKLKNCEKKFKNESCKSANRKNYRDRVICFLQDRCCCRPKLAAGSDLLVNRFVVWRILERIQEAIVIRIVPLLAVWFDLALVGCIVVVVEWREGNLRMDYLFWLENKESSETLLFPGLFSRGLLALYPIRQSYGISKLNQSNFLRFRLISLFEDCI